MYLIDKTYFRNKLEIQGINDSNNGVATKLDDYIDLYVIDFLQSLFGVTDFEELNTNIVRGDLKTTAPQRWLDLVNGKTYTKDGLTKKWNGLIYKVGSVNKSILANVVFCKLFADLETNNGRFSIDVKSSIKNLPKSTYLEVWNEIAVNFLSNQDYLPTITYKNGIKFCDWFGQNNNNFVSLAQYLYDFETDFESLDLCLGYDLKNSFDI